MKVGIDIHKCLDRFPRLFAKLSEELIDSEHEVHIITGESWETAMKQVDDAEVLYTHHFSVIDYHIEQETLSLHQKGDGSWWTDEDVWMETKGIYAKKVGLDIHFDDHAEYAPAFPRSCMFIVVPDKGLEEKLKMIMHMLKGVLN